MAEFCLKCRNEINELNLKRFDVILSRNRDLCEHCGKYKRVVISFSPSEKMKFNEYLSKM